MKPTNQPHHGAHDDHENAGVEHEHSDVNVRAILTFAGIITGVTVVCGVIVVIMFNVFEGQAAGRDPKLSPLALPAGPLPAPTSASPTFGNAPEPKLLTNEPAVLGALRRTEQKQLHEYGWIDQAKGVAHLPIDQAKKLVAERGLPVRATPVDPVLGTHLPAFGESTGGRAILMRPAPMAQPHAPTPSDPPMPKEDPLHSPGGRRGGA